MSRFLALLGPYGNIGTVPTGATRWQDRYAVKDWRSRLTRLRPDEELLFQEWARRNRAPITDDYDMRGFWKSGGTTSINANDGLPHYTDTYKTPLHESFSGESIYADPKAGAPMWNDQDQLVLPDGTILFDERKKRRR
jgi:hypothetical protein